MEIVKKRKREKAAKTGYNQTLKRLLFVKEHPRSTRGHNLDKNMLPAPY